MASIICVRSFPARPTKGRPCASSSAPGPSPTKMSWAFGLPSPKTILVRVLCSLQRVHSPRSSRICSSVSLASLLVASKSDGPEDGRGTNDFGGAVTCTGAAGFEADLGKGDSSIECAEETVAFSTGCDCVECDDDAARPR